MYLLKIFFLILVLQSNGLVWAEEIGLAKKQSLSPIYIGLDAEFDFKGSTSAEAIENGILIAIDEINQNGGLLGGRSLALLERSNHSLPVRSLANIRELASIPDVVALFCGRFSPTVLDSLATIHELKIPMLDPWAAADAITDNNYQPNYVFRLSLRTIGPCGRWLHLLAPENYTN